MKKLLILPLLVLLTGCVSYYYPETAFEDGVYYAEDDPSYVVSSGGYTNSVYYPWYSLDYFYLGYYPSPSYSFAYGYPNGFSVGFNYGFSPWYYPSHYYGYYSPWYGSSHHHHYYPAWRPYRGYNSHHYNDRYRNNHRGNRHDRYAGNNRHDKDRRADDRRNRSGDKSHRDDNSRGRYSSSSVRRYVSTAPNGNRGMVVRNRDSAKVGKNRMHVDATASNKTVKSQAKQPRVTPPSTAQPRIVSRTSYNTERSGNKVRYRSDTKLGRSRTGPVSPATSSKGLVVKTAPVNRDRSSNANGAGQSNRGSVSRQTPARVLSNQGTKQQSRSSASKARSNKSPRVVQSSSKRSNAKQKTSRSDNNK